MTRSLVVAACLIPAALMVGCSAKAPERVTEATSALDGALSDYSAARGKKLADKAYALHAGLQSQNWCLAGVDHSVKDSGICEPGTWLEGFNDAYTWGLYANAHPNELAAAGFRRVPGLAVDRMPQGAIIVWKAGQCGYDATYGHIEVVTDTASSVGCSDFCHYIRHNCAERDPWVYIPTGGDGSGSGGECSVHSDHKLWCTNNKATMYSQPSGSSGAVDELQSTYSWFDCWGTGDRHAGGNTTWYHTYGDVNGAAGWVSGVHLNTGDSFDANPSASGLSECGR